MITKFLNFFRGDDHLRNSVEGMGGGFTPPACNCNNVSGVCSVEKTWVSETQNRRN